jgi:hypothetical protein
MYSHLEKIFNCVKLTDVIKFNLACLESDKLITHAYSNIHYY